MDSFIFEEKVLNSYQTNKIIKYFESKKNLQQDGLLVGNVVNKEIKDCVECNLNFQESNKINDILLSSIIKTSNKYKEKYPFLNNIDSWALFSGYNIQKYNPGQAYFSPHCENSTKNNDRILAWMVYLNTVENGGETYFPHYQKYVKAEEGKCVIWPAYWTHVHHGIPSNNDTKYIATGWFILI